MTTTTQKHDIERVIVPVVVVCFYSPAALALLAVCWPREVVLLHVSAQDIVRMSLLFVLLSPLVARLSIGIRPWIGSSFLRRGQVSVFDGPDDVVPVGYGTARIGPPVLLVALFAGASLAVWADRAVAECGKIFGLSALGAGLRHVFHDGIVRKNALSFNFE